MNTLYLKKLSVAVLVASLGFTSLSSTAGQDSSQRLMIEQTIKQQQQAKATESAKKQADAIKLEECKTMIDQAKHTNGS